MIQIRLGPLMSNESRNKGFISRWSSRKQQAERHRDTADTVQPLSRESVKGHDDPLEPAALHGSPVPLPATTVHAAEEPIEMSEQRIEIDSAEDDDRVQTESINEAPLLSDADMPPIESLSSESDVSAFLNKGVSAALRKAALRHVFSQPAYNVRDGLNDYDGDYTVFEPLGDTVTSDMKWHIARKERERLEAEARELEQRRLEAGNEQHIEEVQAEQEAQAEQQPQEQQAEQEAQAEQQSQELEEGQAEQEARTEQQAQETQKGQAEQEAQAIPQAQDGQAEQEARTPHEAQAHIEFDQARQIDAHETDAHEKDDTRNKPA